MTATADDLATFDLASLRARRRERLLDAMAAHELDALVLGRPADVVFATGARQLWTAGSRPFGPACVVVRATGRAHLLSVWDEGVPPEVSHQDLYGLSWNPANLVASLAAIPALRGARRVGTGSSSPGFDRLVEAVAPSAQVVDGTPAIWAARTRKDPDELACILAATALAEAALAAMVEVLRPGVSERDLLAAYLHRIASLGAPTPPSEGVACATARSGPVALARLGTGEPVSSGQLVVLDPGAVHLGYEGGVGRTWVVGDDAVTAGQRDLAARCRDALGAVVAACRPGATGADLCAAWTDAGEPLPPEPLALGLGLGIEPPVIGAGIGSDAVLVAGTVLTVSGWVTQEGVGGFLERDVVLVDDEPQVLSRAGHGPAAGGA